MANSWLTFLPQSRVETGTVSKNTWGRGRSWLSPLDVHTTNARFSIIHSLPHYITNYPLASVEALCQLKVFRFRSRQWICCKAGSPWWICFSSGRPLWQFASCLDKIRYLFPFLLVLACGITNSWWGQDKQLHVWQDSTLLLFPINRTYRKSTKNVQKMFMGEGWGNISVLQ